MKKINVVKTIAFVTLFLVLFAGVSKVMTCPADYRNYQWIAGFYEEPKESLDAVYIGSSNCYSFWNSLTAWQEYGIAVFPYSTNAQPFAAAKYLIKETKKTQPNALFIVNINTLEDNGLRISDFHHLLDYMPLSMNKLALTNHLAKVGGYTLSESMELYIPMIRYHERWDELVPEDFQYEVDGLKGASSYGIYLHGSTDVTEEYITSEKEGQQEPELEALITDLLDFCDEEQVNVLFVTVPRAEKNEETIQKFNLVNRLIEERGYPTLNLNDKVSEMGIHLTEDYYNKQHTNIHGSIKFTRYLSEYLIENYQFEDKRTEDTYTSWNTAWERYRQIIAPYVLDFELESGMQAFDLKAPADFGAIVEDGSLCITWIPVEDADGYVIYRKEGEKDEWQLVGEAYGTAYTDMSVESGHSYFYTIVPFVEEAGNRYYGNYSFDGKMMEI